MSSPKPQAERPCHLLDKKTQVLWPLPAELLPQL